ncbi:MAG: UDP-3-O-[3-hydroxymyristoyl] N-acetylglucosamine deacetylase [Proteobacteria bacterium]|nr:MAG: UDP-3-O-[3-hydroxymyristoyl] N-acetylglucosamine deacetylase [Pseudomonadota bacterium]
MNQHTIAEKISCTGVGLHTGKPVQLTLHPARAGTGIVFVRTDLPVPVEIPATPESLTGRAHLATTLGRDGATLDTVEHLLAAAYGLGVDNLRVEVDGPEVPGMDGSAASFVFLLRAAGLYEQNARRQTMRITRPIEIRDGQRRVRIEPARGFRVSYQIDFDHPCIGRQSLRDVVLSHDSFEREIARARTFGFVAEVDALWRAGRARGACLDNTVVLDGSRVLNRDGLRFPDEFVRHKVLDLLGDLALLGVRVEGHVKVERGGHALHQKLVEKLAAERLSRRVEQLVRVPEIEHAPRLALLGR